MRYYWHSMQRTPEPELMDEQEQAAAYAREDWSESHGKIPRYFRERFPQFKGGRVVDLGCGTADVTVRFARAFPEVKVVGVDGSDAMLGFGRRAVHEAALEARITLENRYLPDAELESRKFDAVICNSLLHHFADPVELWRTAARCGKPGAPVLLIDLLRPANHEAALQFVDKYTKDAPPILKRDFTASLHAAYTADEVREQLKAAGLPSFKVDEVDEIYFAG